MSLTENEIKQLSYTSSIVKDAYSMYLRFANDSNKNIFTRNLKNYSFFPVYWDKEAEVLYFLFAKASDEVNIKNFLNTHTTLTFRLLKTDFANVNTFIVHFLSVQAKQEEFEFNKEFNYFQSESDFQKPEILKLKDIILSDAVKHHASDIHIVARAGRGKVYFRINGILRLNLEDSITKITALIRSFLNDAMLRNDDLVMPQNGSFQFEVQNQIYNARLNVIGTFSGGSNSIPTAVIRILYQSSGRKLESLGYEPEQLKLFRKMASKEGIIIISGPTGSGKTTTLYALLDWLDLEGKKVVSIEDPPEVIKDEVEQIGIQPSRGITWESALENMLRMDPDIIIVGEIRDRLAAEAVMQASTTGHTVLTTIHTQGVETIAERFKQLAGKNSTVVNEHTLAYNLIGLVSQRLVTKIAIPVATSIEDLLRDDKDLVDKIKSLGIGINDRSKKYYIEDPIYLPNRNITNDKVYKGMDMTENGRTVIAEVVYNDAQFSEYILKGEPKDIRHYLDEKEDHITLVKHAILKVRRGDISIYDVLSRI